jgi:hypothetical protein
MLTAIAILVKEPSGPPLLPEVARGAMGVNRIATVTGAVVCIDNMKAEVSFGGQTSRGEATISLRR